MFRVSFNSSLPEIFIFFLTIFAVFLVFYSYKNLKIKRKNIFMFLHILCLIILLSIIFKPEISLNISIREKNPLYVLIDSSMSMGIKDKNGKTRLDRVKDILRNNGYLERYNPVFFTFGKKLKRISPEKIKEISPSENSTFIIENLKKISEISKGEFSGILLFSDGIDTSPVSKFNGISNVYCVGIGGEDIKDIGIIGVVSNSPLYEGEKIKITVYLRQNGFNGRKAEILLKREGKVIKKNVIQLNSSSTSTTFEIGPAKKGIFIYKVEAVPLPEEKILENNREEIFIRVISPEIKILYVDGSLRWEYRFMKRYLESDIQLQPVFLVRIGENLFQQSEIKKIKIPQDIFYKIEFLSKFDIIILGNIDFSSFSKNELENLKDYVVEKGKSIILTGGENFLKGVGTSPLENILPVEITGKENQFINQIGLSLTQEGKNFPIFEEFPQFPEVQRINRIEKLKEGAICLVKSIGRENLPVVILSIFGNGKCMVVATDSTWRWYFGSRKERKVYELFWGRIIRYMCRVKDYLGIGTKVPYISIDRRVYGKGEEVKVKFSFRKKEEKFNAFLITPEGKRKKLLCKNGKTTFSVLKEGIYLIEAENGGRKNIEYIVVKENGAEFNNIERDEDYLKKISKGNYIRGEDIDKIEKFLKLKKKRVRRSFSISEESRKYLIPFLFILLNICWYLRRQNNII